MTVSNNNTPPADALRVALDRTLLGLRTATPGRVAKVDSQGRWADVQPLVSMVQRLDGEPVKAVALPVLVRVPLMVMGSQVNGLFVAVPVVPGDEGMLVVCDRALDNWQFGDGSPQMASDAATPRHHDLTDAQFYPGAMRAATGIPGYPTDALELRNRSGSVKIAISNTQIDLTGPVFMNGVQVDETHTHGGVSPGAAQTAPVTP